MKEKIHMLKALLHNSVRVEVNVNISPRLFQRKPRLDCIILIWAKLDNQRQRNFGKKNTDGITFECLHYQLEKS
ncbi:hypothetical protein BpHYR1_046944 [Brachionus plicatilis]|uniref:Uncharacterized protein n=1 Tax=Brachionus plicatilis TaxID=10195 RepID=A0A3M7RG98_BRAPC|nr:hypothetical protein BpHYR1_046944 [Brachionus plicatilis]